MTEGRRCTRLRAGTRSAKNLVKVAIGRTSVWPMVGFVRFGSFGRTKAMAPMWPARFGRPVDRYYIDRFLEAELSSAVGEVLEVGNLEYTNRYGGPGITGRSTLHAPVGAGPSTTFVCDLSDGAGLPSSRFDVIVLPQTLLFIFDVQAAVATLHRILKPGGRLLVTVPGISHIVPGDQQMWGQYWSFTPDSLKRLFGDEFGPDNIEVRSYGNVKISVAFLHGLAVEDLRRKDFEFDDPNYPLILTVTAVRATTDEGRPAHHRQAGS